MVWPWLLGGIVGVLIIVVLWLSLATSIPHRRPRSYGFLLATVVMAVALAVAVVPLALDDTIEVTTGSDGGLEGAPMVLVAIAYVAAIAAVIGRRTRGVGQGMLVGLTVLLPVAFLLLVAANLGIIT